MSTKITVSDVVLTPLPTPGVYTVAATVADPRRPTVTVTFTTDARSGRAWISDPVMEGHREIVEPGRYGPRVGKAWVESFYDALGRRMA